MAKNTKVADEVVEVEEITAEFETRLTKVRETAHKGFLAYIGAFAMAADEVVELSKTAREQFNTRIEETRGNTDTLASNMIERGTNFQTDARKRIDEVLEGRRGTLNEQTEKVVNVVEKRVEELLARVNLPTKDSIEQLNKRINSLGRKIDKVRKDQETILSA